MGSGSAGVGALLLVVATANLASLMLAISLAICSSCLCLCCRRHEMSPDDSSERKLSVVDGNPREFSMVKEQTSPTVVANLLTLFL